MVSVAVMLIATLSSCTREETEPQEGVSLPSGPFKVSAQCQTAVKTYMTFGHHKWVTGDIIRVLSREGDRVLSSACQNAVSTFDFEISDWPSGKMPAYAVYCGQKTVSFEPEADGDVLTARLEPVQKITHKGSFAKTANLSAGILTGGSDGVYSVAMKNVCGLLKFSFSEYDDIMSVTIQDMDSQPLAGTVDIMFDDKGEPYVSDIKAGETVLTVSSSGKSNSLGNTTLGELPKGLDYYACILPGTYRLKIIITRNNGQKLAIVGRSPMTVGRNQYIYIGNIDAEAKPLETDGVDSESFTADQNSGLPMHIDFSRVGYHWSEDPLPALPVAVTLTAPEDGSDMTAAIQNALDTYNGAVLLKEGVYNVKGTLYFRHSGVVLRGEGNNTVVVATGKLGGSPDDINRDLIQIGSVAKQSYSSESRIVENAPVGQMWVRVADPGLYKVSDDVALYRPGTAEWISDIRMDQIPQNAENKVKQWTPSTYSLYSSRKVTGISADTVFLDNPVVMSLTDIYGEENRGFLKKVSCDRICECGVENIRLISEFDDSQTDALGNHTDEDHCWSAISIHAAEHSWVRNVTTQYFGYCTVLMANGSRYITVSDCTSLHPVSVITGARRYAFHIATGELCLVKNCRAEEDRHAFVLGPKASGPNVFAFCEAVQAMSDVGPHQRWAMGALYDNQITDGLLAVQDGGNNGTGHGWRGTNFILWNCTANRIVCQSPWATGLNWAVGCIGAKEPGRLKDRLYGEWISHGTPVSPASLYDWQLQQRLEKGIRLTTTLL